jgi:hypothetical protein
MFDLNQILSAALNAAVAEAIKPLVERIATQEALLQNATRIIHERIAALENSPAASQPAITIDEAKMVEALNSQEWFWEKLQRRIDAATEQAVDNHLECYNHDEYDEHIGDDDKHIEGDLDDAVREAVGNLSFEVSVS